jgi:hypothetical protein
VQALLDDLENPGALSHCLLASVAWSLLRTSLAEESAPCRLSHLRNLTLLALSAGPFKRPGDDSPEPPVIKGSGWRPDQY